MPETPPPPPRTRLPDARTTPRFAGVATFGRFPPLASVEPERRPVDWAIYGVPFDGGVTYRPGARFGPRAIREASQYLKPAHPALKINLVEVFSLADAGDAPVKPYSVRETLDAVTEFATGLGDAERTRLFAVGGDHSIAYANIRATWERRGRPKRGLAVLHFDAHLDTVDVVWGERWTHASPFIRAIEDGLIDPSRMLSIGVRGPLNSLRDLDYARERGVELIFAEEVRAGTARDRVLAFRDRLGEEEAYLTFDVDCVDPAFAPGTGTPACGGLSSGEALDLLRLFAGVNLAGADVVEVMPDRDPSGITALLASQVMMEVLSIAAVRAGA